VTAKPDVLSQRRLNRATLARQLLLEPAHLSVVDAVGRIAGLQAQEPASPYIGSWARLAAFDPADLDAAIAARDVVKGTLMRVTLHLVTAADYRAFWPAVRPGLEQQRRQQRLEPPSAEAMTALIDRVTTFAAEPRSLGELRDHVGDVDGLPAEEIVWWLRRRLPLAHAPTPGAWSFGRRPLLAAADAWLPSGTWHDDAAAVEYLVRHYLAAFGPASLADIAQWSGLTVARLRPGVEAIDAAGELRRYRSEAGRQLVDLVGAPLPDDDVPAPPRLLPMWDSTVLAFADRTRIVSDADRARIIARNGDTLPVILVDGVVAGRWWAVTDRERTRIELEPFRRLAAQDRRALEALADRLARFVEPYEPRVYARYQRWRTDER
jgi:Winged helix DNA-binding domain